MRLAGSLAVLSTLCLAATAHANLLRNGDFEAGNATGWIGWRAPWGQGEQRIFNDTTPGHSGNYDLKISATGSSFGVYQIVNVTPGQTYRLEARWKFDNLSDPGWTEIMILQGGWDYNAADIRPGDLVNKMYSYDNPENPPVAFDWLDTASLDGTAADINSYYGERTATTTRMTVVLKAGGNPTMAAGQSVVAYFDDVSLVEVPEPATLLLVLGGFACYRRRTV